MKYVMQHLSTLFLISIIPLTSTAWQEYHGGDLERIQLHSLASQVLLEARKIPTTEKDANLLYKAFYSPKTLLIFTNDELIIDQKQKTAIVKKEKSQKACDDNNICQLVINFKNWTDLKNNEKELLLIHEMYNLSATPDTNYDLSSAFYEKISLYRSLDSSLESYVANSMKSCEVKNLIDISPLILTKEYIEHLQAFIDKEPAQYCDSVRTIIKKIAQHFEISQDN